MAGKNFKSKKRIERESSTEEAAPDRDAKRAKSDYAISTDKLTGDDGNTYWEVRACHGLNQHIINTHSCLKLDACRSMNFVAYSALTFANTTPKMTRCCLAKRYHKCIAIYCSMVTDTFTGHQSVNCRAISANREIAADRSTTFTSGRKAAATRV